MKLYLMTDLEGVAGVIDNTHWTGHGGRYYDNAKRLLTEETNAAIRGFIDGGFDDIIVQDCHGPGAINLELLDPRARMQRGWWRDSGAYPYGLDKTFDAIAFVGQHAKPGTTFSHLTHFWFYNFLDVSVNGVSVGEYGQMALVAGELDIPVIFAAGEKALCEEARALTPHVVTAAVKEGTVGGTGDELDTAQYIAYHNGAIHMSPARARELIEPQARAAATAFAKQRSAFRPLKLAAPYACACKLRAWKEKDKPARSYTVTHPSSVIAVLNMMLAQSD